MTRLRRRIPIIPTYFIPLIYAGLFALILVAVVPRAEIRRLSIYGIIFGSMFDVTALLLGYVTGIFAYINYGPFGFMNIHFFAPLSWALFFILYFYFLPKNKFYLAIYVASAILFSYFFDHIIVSMGVFKRSGLLATLICFPVWFITATWGFYKLTGIFEKENDNGK